MTPKSKRRVLISVYDKTGVVEFARNLVSAFDFEVLSTGGTATLLASEGLPVTLVEKITGCAEMMDGRVKTLHPHIHAAILANRRNPDHVRQLADLGIAPIEIVAVNLYPFEETISQPDCTFEHAMEMIDIGGPCMLRAAAKNHVHVVPICDPSQYDECLAFLQNPDDERVADLRERFAMEAFSLTARYDMMIDSYLAERSAADDFDGMTEPNPIYTEEGAWYEPWGIIKPLRYGENPHLRASFLHECESAEECEGTITPLHVVAGGEVSYNNYNDGHAALELTRELTRAYQTAGKSPAAVVFVKHTNACGASIHRDAVEAYRAAYLGDANAAMGGVLCCNFDIGRDFAGTVMETYDRWGRGAGAGGFFLEVWIARRFDEAAIRLIQSAKKWGERVRLLAVGNMTEPPDPWEPRMRHVSGGWLAQEPDFVGLNEDDWTFVTDRGPTEAELADLRLAWLVCKHTKSNAITLCKDQILIGNGAGQMSRVMSCRVATWLAEENGHKARLHGSVAASDAFFPFADGAELLMKAGVKAMIQPGGSKRDIDAIRACNARDVAMVFTGTRHFKH